jgi:hypothetical protein
VNTPTVKSISVPWLEPNTEWTKLITDCSNINIMKTLSMSCIYIYILMWPSQHCHTLSLFIMLNVASQQNETCFDYCVPLKNLRTTDLIVLLENTTYIRGMLNLQYKHTSQMPQ